MVVVRLGWVCTADVGYARTSGNVLHCIVRSGTRTKRSIDVCVRGRGREGVKDRRRAGPRH